MRPLILTAALLFASLPAAAQSIPTVPTDFPAPGTFCGLFQLCEPAPLVTRGAGK